jgi:hypothetical protein
MLYVVVWKYMLMDILIFTFDNYLIDVDLTN